MYKESIIFRDNYPEIIEHMIYLASKDASQMGYGYSKMRSSDTAWILSRFSMNITGSIKSGDNLDILTESYGTDGLFYYRRFEINKINGDRCAHAHSAWIIIDINKRMPVKNNFSEFSPVSDSAILPQRIRVDASKGKQIKEIIVEKQHIDVNGHVNNIHYIKWILEGAGLQSFSSLDINYIKESFEGDKLTLYSINRENNSIYFLKSPKNNKIAVGARLTV